MGFSSGERGFWCISILRLYTSGSLLMSNDAGCMCDIPRSGWVDSRVNVRGLRRKHAACKKGQLTGVPFNIERVRYARQGTLKGGWSTTSTACISTPYQAQASSRSRSRSISTSLSVPNCRASSGYCSMVLADQRPAPSGRGISSRPKQKSMHTGAPL